MQRLAAASGIGFAVLIVLSSWIPGGAPVYEDLAPAYAAYYAEQGDEINLAVLLLGFAVVEALWFIGYFRGVLNTADVAAGGEGRLTSVGFAGGLLGIGFAGLGGLLQGAAAKLPEGGSAEVLMALHQASVETVNFAEICLAVFLLASGLVILRTAVLPAWIALFGFVPVLLWTIAFFQVIAPEQDSGPLGSAGFVAFFGFVLWSVATSVVLVRRVRPDAAPPPAPGSG